MQKFFPIFLISLTAYAANGQEFVKLAEFSSPLKRNNFNYLKIQKVKNNFFWFYTTEGLYRFDGQNFENAEKLQATVTKGDFDSSNSYFYYKGSKNVELRTDKSNLCFLPTNFRALTYNFNMSIKDYIVFNEHIDKLKYNNNPLRSELIEPYNCNTGTYLRIKNNKFCFVNNAGKLFEFFFPFTLYANDLVIVINNYCLYMHRDKKMYSVIKENKILATLKFNDDLISKKLLSLSHLEDYQNGITLINNDSLYVLNIDANYKLSSKSIGKFKEKTNLKLYYYDAALGILLTTYTNGSIEKYILTNNHFKIKKRMIKK